MSTQHTPRLIGSGNLVEDELYRALDALYSRGWKDRSQEQDYDPRGTTQWQAVLDLFRYQPNELAAQLAELVGIIDKIGIEVDALKYEPAECPDLWKLVKHLRHIAKHRRQQ